jgi:hypothetical protein
MIILDAWKKRSCVYLHRRSHLVNVRSALEMCFFRQLGEVTRGCNSGRRGRCFRAPFLLSCIFKCDNLKYAGSSLKRIFYENSIVLFWRYLHTACGTATGFSLSTSTSSCQYHCTSGPCSFSYLCFSYQKGKWGEPWQYSNTTIPIYFPQDSALHSLFMSGNCCTCFGCYFHPSSGVYVTVSTVSGICHTDTAC